MRDSGGGAVTEPAPLNGEITQLLETVVLVTQSFDAEPVDDLVTERVLGLLATPAVREALLAQAGAGDDRTIGGTLADLGAAQSRLQGLDDDFYVRGALAEGRYKSIRVKLEREIDRLHVIVDGATKQRSVLHPDPRAFWAEADFQQRRDLVRLMVQRVEVMPGNPAAGSTRLGCESRFRRGDPRRFRQPGRS